MPRYGHFLDFSVTQNTGLSSVKLPNSGKKAKFCKNILEKRSLYQLNPMELIRIFFSQIFKNDNFGQASLVSTYTESKGSDNVRNVVVY